MEHCLPSEWNTVCPQNGILPLNASNILVVSNVTFLSGAMGGPTSVSPFFVKVLHLYLHCATVLPFVSHLCYAYGAISIYFSHSTTSIYSQFLNTSNIQSVEGYHEYKVSGAAVQYRDTSFT